MKHGNRSQNFKLHHFEDLEESAAVFISKQIQLKLIVFYVVLSYFKRKKTATFIKGGSTWAEITPPCIPTSQWDPFFCRLKHPIDKKSC